MKKIYCGAFLMIRIFLLIGITSGVVLAQVSPPSSGGGGGGTEIPLRDGAELEYAQKRVKGLEYARYYLYLYGRYVTDWRDDDPHRKTLHLTGLPAGDYQLQGSKHDATGYDSFNGHLNFTLPLSEESGKPELIFHLNRHKTFDVVLQGLPEGLTDDYYSATLITENGDGAYGEMRYDPETNTLQGQLYWVNVFGRYSSLILRDRDGNIHAVSINIDFVDAALSNYPILSPYVPEHQGSRVGQTYEHDKWLRHGVSREITVVNEVHRYGFTATPGQEVRVRTYGGYGNGMIEDTMIRIEDQHGNMMLPDHPNARPMGDDNRIWIDDANDYGEGTRLYEDVRFVAPDTDVIGGVKYYLVIRGYGSRTGRYNAQAMPMGEEPVLATD